MVGRLIISLNWALGSLALILAFSGPKLMDTFQGSVNKTEAVKAAKQIAEGQNAYFALHKRNLEFSRSTANKVLPNLNVQLNLNLSNYDYDGSYSDDGSYVIRAVSRPRSLRSNNGLLPAYNSVRIYNHIMPSSSGGKSIKKTGWLKMSGKKSGILSHFIN